MRIPPMLLANVFLAFVVGSSSVCAQFPRSLPGCEPPDELHKALNEILSSKLGQGVALSQLLARRRQQLAEVAAKYPREVEPQRRLIQETRSWWGPDQLRDLQIRYRSQAALNTEDPLALFLEGAALFHTDTPESIHLLEKAKAIMPMFPWSALQLAEIYSGGKHADKQKASENIAGFFAICPSSTDPRAQYLLGKVGDASLQARVASALRARLAKEADPDRLKDYKLLWSLEFRVRPPQEHDVLRNQVAEDLKRLEAIKGEPDAEWLAFLLTAYKLTGASNETLRAKEDRLLQEHANSELAFNIVSQRWRTANQEPEDHGDAPAWAKYNAAYMEAAKAWVRDFPDVPSAAYLLFVLTLNGESLTESEGLVAMRGYEESFMEHDLRLASTYIYPDLGTWTNVGVAEFLIRHKWQPERVIALLREAEANFERGRVKVRQDDNLSDEELTSLEIRELEEQQEVATLMLDAAISAGWPKLEETLRVSIEGAAPKERKNESRYWWNRAKLAVFEGRKTDALAYYQLALKKRLVQPQPSRGTITDGLGKEARHLWEELGGTETAWIVWSKPAPTGFQEVTEVRWEKPKQQLPSFELADLSGKVWRSKELVGRSIFVNVWATWCGPCLAELPSLEKLYQRVKGRDDIRILTFNVDQNAGVVEPFVKEKGYTFPVVPAYGLVQGFRDDTGIPQNWIADPKGNWRWVQLGFDSTDRNWADEMIRRLESVKATD